MRTFAKLSVKIAISLLIIGIILLVVAIFSGGYFYSSNEKYDYNLVKEYKDIKSIKLHVSYGELNVKKGDNFKIVAKNMKKNTFHCEVVDGTWVISDNYKRHDFHFGFINFNNKYSPKITIYVPKTFQSEQLELELGAGAAKIESLNAKTTSIELGAGELDINQLISDGKTDISVGAGKLKIADITAKNVSIDSGVGKTDIRGVITGNNKVECGIGNVDLKLKGNREDYDYNISCGLGSIGLNDNSYGVSTDKSITNKNSKYSFDLECGVGNLELDINN